MNDAHHQGAWGAPQIGMSYRDGEGRQFLVFSLTADFIYLEYGSGEMSVLCRGEWDRLEARPATASPAREREFDNAWATA